MVRDPQLIDQQPTQRVVGKRERRPLGEVPPADAREALARDARYRTRAPKGIYVYASHEEMSRDRERWLVERMVELQLGSRAS